MKNFLCILIPFLLIISCDPCDDCDTVVFEPTISLVFINQDSINILDNSLKVFAYNDSAVSANIDSLDILRDSLQTVTDSIANGGNLDSEKMDLEQWIADRQSDSTLFATANEDADSLRSVFNTIKSSINSGLMRLKKLEILGTSNVFTYEDSATTWSIPLSYDGEFTQYEVTIGDFSDVLEFAYDNVQELDEERNVLIRAENIRLASFTDNAIDSVLTNCEETCIDGEATFIIYF